MVRNPPWILEGNSSLSCGFLGAGGEKIRKHVDFPRQLDLNPYTSVQADAGAAGSAQVPTKPLRKNPSRAPLP